MEKIININFQGRVIPIEENAYTILKQYIDSLKQHFASEESSDEIVSDIENRIAELFSDRLKRGANCIGNADVNAVIDNIGRLEDIEAAEGEENKEQKNTYTPPVTGPVLKERFFRNADDKIIAGVCSGIAYRTGMDPVVVRILFVLLAGAFFWVYILLWIIVPSKSIQTNITRRLYRNPDDKVIAGVCGGLAAYFRTDSWIPRLIFALPLVIGVFSRSAHFFWWHMPWGWGPHIFAGSFGGTLLISYIILWIAVPYARSAADRLEMRGEKVDMNAIKTAAQANAAAPVYPRRTGSGIGRAIGIVFKAFFLFIGGTIAISLFCVLIALVCVGFAAIPFTDFLMNGWWQHTLLWAGIMLFLGIPFLALATWLVRRLMGVHSQRHYLGPIFSGLWLIGFIGIVVLASILVGSFRTRSLVEETFTTQQPSGNKLYINVNKGQGLWSDAPHSRWYGDWEDDGAPFHIVNNDSLWLNTVKVSVTESADSLFHIYETRLSRGNTPEEAKALASHISFVITQNDSIINLPRGFAISSKDKFRNQQVLITVEVPAGKKIQFNKDIHKYAWFNIKVNEGRNFRYERHWDEDDNYRSNREYIMTTSGLKNPGDSTDTSGDDDDDDDD